MQTIKERECDVIGTFAWIRKIEIVQQLSAVQFF